MFFSKDLSTSFFCPSTSNSLNSMSIL